jgi:NAD(P)-dependent dehydrogenase (short-subunit alcohol dehydrogenase family)
MERLEGKICLVTGGTRGIGAGIARTFVAEGATVAYAGTRAARIDGAEGFVAELGDPQAPARLVAEVTQRFGGLDVLVNNAGVGSRSNEWELTPEEWDRVHAVNLRATFFLAREAARSMRERGGGSIVNIASIAGQNGGIAGSPAYAASKGAVIALTRSLARRFAPHRIRVNCLSPADIETDMTAGWPHDLRERLIALTPLARFGAVEEVTGAAVYFASDESTFVTGQTLSINGGAFMS